MRTFDVKKLYSQRANKATLTTSQQAEMILQKVEVTLGWAEMIL